MKNKTVILIIVFIGILAAAYGITLHFAPSSSSFCNIGETFNCDKVNKSPWSEFLGIPVAILGFLSYLLLFFAVLMRKRVQRWTAFTSKDYWQYLFSFVVIMLLFQVYLTMTEIFFIHAYCIICLVSQTCTILLAWLIWRNQ